MGFIAGHELCMPEMVRAESIVNQERNTYAEKAHYDPEYDAVSLLYTDIISTIMRCSCHVSSPPLLFKIPLQQALEQLAVTGFVPKGLIGLAAC